MTSYHPMKSVQKSLRVLELINAHPFSRVRDLVEATGIPAPTVVRILETLAAEGFVQQEGRLAGYCVTDKVMALSSGCHGLPGILEPVCRIADELTASLRWPASVATLDGDAMIVRYSTIPASPLAHIHSTINRRLSLTRRAHGRAYLAFCPLEERLFLLSQLRESAEEQDSLDPEALETKLASIRMAGHARRDRTLQPDTSTIAVPLFHDQRLIATLGMTFFARVVPDPSGLVRELRAAANRNVAV